MEGQSPKKVSRWNERWNYITKETEKRELIYTVNRFDSNSPSYQLKGGGDVESTLCRPKVHPVSVETEIGVSNMVRLKTLLFYSVRWKTFIK